MFLSTESNYFTNYADDTTPYAIGNNSGEVVSDLETIAEKLLTWFAQNEMKTNLDKCHLLPSTTEEFNFQILETVIHNSHSRTLLGVTFDKKIKSERHITAICHKANRKLNAPARVISYMDLQKRLILMNVFFNSQFNYSPVIWMFHSRVLNNKINRPHERCLRIVYNDKTSTFNEHLEKDNSVYIHYRNTQALVIETSKVANGMSPVIMNEIFQLREESRYNVRYTSNFVIPPIRSGYHGNESASYLEPKIWELIPPVIRQI